MTHIAMLSYGQDSSAMVVKMLEEGLQLDYIVFTDTGLEFDMMYQYKKDFDAYIKRRFDMEVTTIGASHKFDEFCFGKFTKGEREGQIRGLPMTLGMQYCTRELKVVPFEKWAKQFDDITLYIGYTYSELKRADVQDERQKFPLIDFKMREQDITPFLQERNIWNPLYKHFTRTGCYLCPKQKKEAFFKLWKHYPKEWAKMLWYEKKCKDIGAYNQTFCFEKKYVTKIEDKQRSTEVLTDYDNIDENDIPYAHTEEVVLPKTLLSLEKEFKIMDKQQGFEFEEDPMLSCFCGL